MHDIRWIRDNAAAFDAALAALGLPARSAVGSLASGECAFVPTEVLHLGLKRLLDVRRADEHEAARFRTGRLHVPGVASIGAGAVHAVAVGRGRGLGVGGHVEVDLVASDELVVGERLPALGRRALVARMPDDPSLN